MSQELLINVTPRETRVALVDNGSLQEVFIERARRRGLVGNVYLGEVSRVLPGMQAAFVDIGLARTAFLHASDITAAEGVFDSAPLRPVPIQQLVKEQQRILVQVIKDPIGSKGARLTTQLSIPSRHLVLLANNPVVGISGRLEDSLERDRLREFAEQQLVQQGSHGVIVRTAAEGVAEADLKRDWSFLHRIWEAINQRAGAAQPGTMVHEDLPLLLRILRDLPAEQIEHVRIDSMENYARADAFCQAFLPETKASLVYYPGERPLFDLYGVEDEIQRALQRRVALKSGGHLVIDQTEAMTTVDVNTGGYVGHRNLEETIFKTNLEAAQAITRQLRLRNLGGIIIIDFIDMEEADHQRQVLRALEKGLQRDHARTGISGVSALGLVEITRKRTRESLQHLLCDPCTICGGRGYLKSPETIVYEIAREILREVRQFDVERLLVLAAQEVVDLAMDEESDSFAELEQFIGRPVKFQAEPLYTPEQFDVVLM